MEVKELIKDTVRYDQTPVEEIEEMYINKSSKLNENFIITNVILGMKGIFYI